MIRSLHGKLVISAGLAGTITVVGLAYFYLESRWTRIEEFHIEGFTQHCDMIMGALWFDLAEGGMDSVRVILDHHAHDPDISDIKLIDSRGRVVISASGMEGQVDTVLKGIDSVFRSESRFVRRKDKLLSIVKRIGNSPECHRCHGSDAAVLGYLETDFRFVPSQVDTPSFYGLLLGAGVLFLVLLSIALWLFQHILIRRRLADLMLAIVQVKEGDLSARARVSGSDEISRIQASFNELVSRLEATQRKLETLHEREMERAERLATAGELASGIAHEIKNPLAGISATIQVMLGDELGNTVNKDILVEMANQIRRIEKAVSDLLSYACPRVPEFKKGNLNENIVRCISIVSPIAEQQATSIVARLEDTIPDFLMDSMLIDQIIVNILMNALQALKRGGTVTVASGYEIEEKMASVCIVDDGPGMPPETASQVFRPFYTTKHKGSGLGLSICVKNVKRHLGTIEVESSVGKGTVFTFHLPTNATFQELVHEDTV